MTVDNVQPPVGMRKPQTALPAALAPQAVDVFLDLRRQ
jgi:hypothetical protein